jgi:hypothetical protein
MSKYKYSIGQTVVFKYVNKFRVGKVFNIVPTSKGYRYSVASEDGKAYDELYISLEGDYRIDKRLTSDFCTKYDIKISEIDVQQAKRLQKIQIIQEEMDSFSPFEPIVDTETPVVSDIYKEIDYQEEHES